MAHSGLRLCLVQQSLKIIQKARGGSKKVYVVCEFIANLLPLSAPSFSFSSHFLSPSLLRIHLLSARRSDSRKIPSANTNCLSRRSEFQIPHDGGRVRGEGRDGPVTGEETRRIVNGIERGTNGPPPDYTPHFARFFSSDTAINIDCG